MQGQKRPPQRQSPKTPRSQQSPALCSLFTMTWHPRKDIKEQTANKVHGTIPAANSYLKETGGNL